MNDIVERLRASVTQCRAVDRSELLAEAADEIADLRFGLRQATDRASLAEVKCSQLLAAVVLTDAEREAIEVAAVAYSDDHGELFAATLRGLLERMQ